MRVSAYSAGLFTGLFTGLFSLVHPLKHSIYACFRLFGRVVRVVHRVVGDAKPSIYAGFSVFEIL